jgi:hypothetical protein
MKKENNIMKKIGLIPVVSVFSIFSLGTVNLAQAGADDVLSYQLYYANKSSSQTETDPYDLFGLYTYYGFGKNSIEFAVDGQSSKNYPDGSPVDAALVYGNYDIPNVTLKVGGRAADIDNVFNQTNIGFLGAQYTQYSPYGFVKWLVGVDAYVLDAEDDVNGVDSTQISPYVGGYVVTEQIPKGHSLFLKLQINRQSSDGNPLLSVDSSYESAQLSTTYATPSWSTGLDLIGGKSHNLIESSAFVYNSDFYNYEAGAKVWGSLSLGKTSYIKPWVKVQNVEKTANNTTVDQLYTVGVLIGASF